MPGKKHKWEGPVLEDRKDTKKHFWAATLICSVDIYGDISEPLTRYTQLYKRVAETFHKLQKNEGFSKLCERIHRFSRQYPTRSIALVSLYLLVRKARMENPSEANLDMKIRKSIFEWTT